MPKLTRPTGTKGILSFVTPCFAADRVARLPRPFAAERRRSGESGAAGRTASPLRSFVAPLGLVVCFAQAAIAQCATQWLPGDGIPGVNGTVNATVLRDPDGPAGPLPPKLVVGGSFTMAGTVAANNIAEWDPATGGWTALGSGTGSSVYALAVMPNGDLMAGGGFTTAGGLAVNRIAKWNGVTWAPLGTGLTGQWGTAGVYTLHVFNGDLIVGGDFNNAGGVSANRIARWNGSSWAALGSGLNGPVNASVSTANGLFVGGSFTNAGGVGANNIARWTGATWSALGAGTNSAVNSLAALPNGNLVAGGYFSSAGGLPCNNIAQWTGSAWSAMGAGVNGMVFAMAVKANGDLMVGGDSNSIARWNSSGWSSFGPLTATAAPAVKSLAFLPNGDMVAGGGLSGVGPVTSLGIVKWSGTAWSSLNSGFTGWISELEVMPGGNLVASGGLGNYSMATWNGSTWAPLGSGSPHAWALAILTNGDLVAGGDFTSAGGVPVSKIARWNGSTWNALGSGLGTGYPDSVEALTVLSNGDLVAGGGFTFAGGVPVNNIARWNGSSWTALGTGFNARVTALAVLPGGDLVAGGFFTAAGGVAVNRVARWDGTAWLPLGSGLGGDPTYSTVRSLAILPNGDLVAAGEFTSAGGAVANRIARWNGVSWSALGQGFNYVVWDMVILSNGDVMAGGDFTASGAVTTRKIARWNGSVWTEVGAGADTSVFALARMPNGDLALGGDFTRVGGNVSARFARLTTTCPATAHPIPTACTGLTGPITLTADSLPWTGSTFRSRTTGFAPTAIAASLLGFGSPGTPLPLLTPMGLPGCDLLASPDSFLFLVPASGAVSWQFAIPNSVAWAGVPMFHQTLQLEFGPAPGAMALSSSNALALTLGTF